MPTQHESISIRKVVLGITAVALSSMASYFGTPLLAGHDRAINILASIFSILAGFLILVSSLLSDASFVPEGSWRLAEHHLKNQRYPMIRAKLMVLLFLGVLACLVVASLSPLRENHAEAGKILLKWRIVDYVTMFMSSMGLCLSFALPSMLHKLQQQKLESLVNDRRQRDVDAVTSMPHKREKVVA